METTFENKCQILAELWLNYREDEEFQDFVSYNDLGLPLAYAVAYHIIEESPMATQFINETFRLLLSGLGVEEDLGFEVFEDVLEVANND